MQRIAILGGCALLLVGFVWLLLHANEPGVALEDGGSAGPSQASARAEGVSDAAQREARSANEPANPLRAAGSAAARAPGALAAPTAPRDDDPAATPVAAGSSAPFTRTPSGPDPVGPAPVATAAAPPPMGGGAARAERAPEPKPEPKPEPSERPVLSSADPEQCGVFSAAQIALRVEKALPAGSMPEEQLAAVRKVEQKRLCDQARRAPEFAN